MREAQRPIAERVSLLDRSPRAADRLAVKSRPSLTRRAEHLERVRLAFEVGDRMVLIGRDDDDSLYVMFCDSSGGGACGSMRWVLREHGAIAQMSSNGQRVVVTGIVSDEVTAVRVGDVSAMLRNNAFMADIGADDSPRVVLTTADGDREVGPSAL
jgi:hypothetical protein